MMWRPLLRRTMEQQKNRRNESRVCLVTVILSPSPSPLLLLRMWDGSDLAADGLLHVLAHHLRIAAVHRLRCGQLHR